MGMSVTLKVEERDDLFPLCPHCDAPLDRLYFRLIREALAGRPKAYFCPDCQHLLGFAPH